jgi:hypothetical protein
VKRPSWLVWRVLWFGGMDSTQGDVSMPFLALFALANRQPRTANPRCGVQCSSPKCSSKRRGERKKPVERGERPALQGRRRSGARQRRKAKEPVRTLSMYFSCSGLHTYAQYGKAKQNQTTNCIPLIELYLAPR